MSTNVWKESAASVLRLDYPEYGGSTFLSECLYLYTKLHGVAYLKTAVGLMCSEIFNIII
jgi:hypothetical protein